MTTPAASGSAFLERAVDLAVKSATAGGGPFGAVIVKDDQVIATGENRVTRDNDPSAHAEVTAIRRAGQALGTFALHGCVLYSSCEPCPMCASPALWARLDAVVFAADRQDAARGGFDDARFWALMRTDYQQWDIPVRLERIPGFFDPFDAWTSFAGRTPY